MERPTGGRTRSRAVEAKAINNKVARSFSKRYVCYPKSDSHNRFLLGERGSRNLIAIGLNPSSADAQELDPTSKNIKALALQNDCDGWFLLNLYPQRTPKPKNLPTKPNSVLMRENLHFINSFLTQNKSVAKIVFCWGNFIDHLPYLRESRDALFQLAKQQAWPCYSMGITQRCHPIHPSPLAVNRIFGGIHKACLHPFVVRMD